MNVLKNAHFAVSGEETINFIDSAEKAVRWPWVEVETDAEVVVKLSEDTPEVNTWIVKSHAVIPCGVSTIYLSGSANVQIVGLSAPLENSFKSGGKGGESWVNATGNPVTLTGLQGGVPFNSVEVRGKNHVPNTYKSTTIGDMTFSVNVDGSIHAVGTTPTGGANYRVTANLPLSAYGLKAGDTVFCSAKNGMTAEGEMHFKFRISDGTFVKDYNSKREFAPYTIADNVVSMDITLWFPAGGLYGSIYYPQIEINDKYTGYEPPIVGKEMALMVNGTSYTLTPDTNPYTVPMDITQVDGTNVITADNGVISVNANRKNPQLAKVYDIAKRHLLFDGVTDADSPAVVDLGPYEFVEETSYMTSSSGNTHVTDFMMAVDDFVSHDRIITAMQSSGFETRISSVGKVCNVYVISSGGAKMTNTKIYGIK